MWEGAGEPMYESGINESGDKLPEKCPHCGQPFKEKSQAWGNTVKVCLNPDCPGKKEKNGWGK